MVYTVGVERRITVYDVYRCRLAEEAAANRRYIHERAVAWALVAAAACLLILLLIIDAFYLEEPSCPNHTCSNSTTSHAR